MIESINSSDISIRKRSCAYIILRSKKNDLKIIFYFDLKKVVSGNRLYLLVILSCWINDKRRYN